MHGPVVDAAPAHVQAVQTREKRRAGISLDAEPLENAVPVEYRHPERHEGTAAALAAPLGADVVGEREQVEVAPGVRAKPQSLGRLRAVVQRLVLVTHRRGDGYDGCDVALRGRAGDDRRALQLVLVRGLAGLVCRLVLDDDAAVSGGRRRVLNIEGSRLSPVLVVDDDARGGRGPLRERRPGVRGERIRVRVGIPNGTLGTRGGCPRGVPLPRDLLGELRRGELRSVHGDFVGHSIGSIRTSRPLRRAVAAPTRARASARAVAAGPRTAGLGRQRASLRRRGALATHRFHEVLRSRRVHFHLPRGAAVLETHEHEAEDHGHLTAVVLAVDGALQPVQVVPHVVVGGVRVQRLDVLDDPAQHLDGVPQPRSRRGGALRRADDVEQPLEHLAPAALVLVRVVRRDVVRVLRRARRRRPTATAAPFPDRSPPDRAAVPRRSPRARV